MTVKILLQQVTLTLHLCDSYASLLLIHIAATCSRAEIIPCCKWHKLQLAQWIRGCLVGDDATEPLAMNLSYSHELPSTHQCA